MGKIGIIIAREFNTRVRKKSFIITTLLMPLLFVGLMVAPTLLLKMDTDNSRTVLVIDHSDVIGAKLNSNSKLIFQQTDKSEEDLKIQQPGVFGFIVIEEDAVKNPNNIKLHTYESSTLDTESAINRELNRVIEDVRLLNNNIEGLDSIITSIKSNARINSFKIEEDGAKNASSSALSMGIAYVFGLFIYMFTFMYGMMVMQGVIEEKSSKVVEVLISSVKPFQLMMGKIIGIASVAITQFLIWMVLIVIFSNIALQMITIDPETMQNSMQMGTSLPAGVDKEAMTALTTLTDWSFLLSIFGSFVIYFIGGYLLYAAMFAAVGSAVNSVEESQQLQLPITIPLLLSIFIMISVIKEPNSTLAVIASIIPFTSPVVMMARIPYGVPTWELVTSIVLLYSSFIGMVWVASKIYRVGIFMHGKRPSFKELFKWIKYN